MNIKQLFCKHNFIDKCKVDKYRKTIKAKNLEISWQELCYSKTRNGHCKRHDQKGNIFNSYCEFYYQQCTKCGRIKEFNK